MVWMKINWDPLWEKFVSQGVDIIGRNIAGIFFLYHKCKALIINTFFRKFVNKFKNKPYPSNICH